MNYLAHLCLSGPDADWIVGNLAGDYVKGEPERRVPPGLVCGVRLHRAIDRYTDAHSTVRRAARRLPSARRRYAGVAIDMAFDHFLARDWQADDPSGFAEARQRAYALLRHRWHELPGRFQPVARAMAAQDWWASYATFDGIAHALTRMSQRLSRPNALADTVGDIAAAYTELDGDFQAFWPEITAFASAERNRIDHSSQPMEMTTSHAR